MELNFIFRRKSMNEYNIEKKGRAQQKFKKTDYVSDFYKSLKEAEATLEYTLLFPKIQPITDSNSDKWIEEALLRTYTNCHLKIFHQNQYNFFGTIPQQQIGKDYPLYRQMNNFYQDSVYFVQNLYQNDFFASSILNQCLMSAYDSIIKLIHPYYISVSSLFQIAEIGFTELTHRKLIDYNQERLYKNCSEVTFPNPRSPEDDLDNRLPNLRNTLKHYHTVFKNGCPLLSDSISESQWTLLCNSDIIYSIVTEINAKAFSSFLSMYNNKFLSQYSHAKKLDEIHNALYHAMENAMNTRLTSNKSKINFIDQLYFYYRIERIFSLDLLNCIFQNIIGLKNSKSIYPDGVNELREIAAIGKLPNVFSRNAYLQYAFEAIKGKSDISKSIFWQKERPLYQSAFGKLSDEYPLRIWRDIFLHFACFFGDYAIPIQEWYFLITLFKTVSLHDTNLSQSTELGLSELQKLQKLLAIFIEKNAYNICRQIDRFMCYRCPKQKQSYYIIHPLFEPKTTSGVFSCLNYTTREHYCTTLQALNKYSTAKYSLPIQELSPNVLLREYSKSTDITTIQQNYVNMIIER